jgi:hypothetical protein
MNSAAPRSIEDCEVLSDPVKSQFQLIVTDDECYHAVEQLPGRSQKIRERNRYIA